MIHGPHYEPHYGLRYALDYGPHYSSGRRAALQAELRTGPWDELLKLGALDASDMAVEGL